MAEALLRTRLKSYFSKYPNKKVSLTNDLVNHLTEFNAPLIYYHTKKLLDDGFILRLSKGIYQINPNYKSPESIREEITQRMKDAPAVIQNGTPFDPKTPPITVVENPRMIAFLGHAWGQSILTRMKALNFTTEEIEFIGSLIKEKYHVTEQMLISLKNGGR
jgi:hypothetical protein